MPPDTGTDAAAVTVPALVDAFAAGQQQLLDHLLAIVRAILGSLTSWYSDADVTEMVQALVPQIEAAQEQIGSLTNAYLAQVTSELVGHQVQPATRTIDPGTLRLGTTHEAAYERLGANYRYLQSTTGKSDQEAATATLERAQVMAQTDTALAMRDQSHLFLMGNGDRISGYRRVIHPELTRNGTCGLCAAASTRVYKIQALMPMHSRCVCTVLPIVNGVDVGHRMNQADLGALYKAAGNTGAANLKRVRIAVRHNGELGPVLVRADWAHRGPAEVAADLADTAAA